MNISLLRFLAAVFYCSLLLCLGACGGNDWEPGVVARVNGEPIYMRYLEAKYDFEHFEWNANQLPQTDDLKTEYQDILLDLIVQKLVEEELEELDAPVSDQEVLAKEEEIRNDYPAGEFENILVEEYVDLNYWREQIKAGLQWKHFERKYLRPRVEVELEEIREYYREHAPDFYIPRQVHFLLVSAPEAGIVSKALEDFKKGKSSDAIRNKYEEVTVHKYSMHEEQVPPVWSAALKSLEPGKSSRVKNNKNNFYALHVIKHEKEKILEPYQAYTVIEEKLMQKKEKAVFMDWLENKLKDSNIEISSRLKKEK
jgi:hypothetical protein